MGASISRQLFFISSHIAANNASRVVFALVHLLTRTKECGHDGVRPNEKRRGTTRGPGSLGLRMSVRAMCSLCGERNSSLLGGDCVLKEA